MSKKILFKCAAPLSRNKMREFCTKVTELNNGLHNTSMRYLADWMNIVMQGMIDIDTYKRISWCKVLKGQESSIEKMLESGELYFQLRNENDVKKLHIEMIPFECVVVDEKDATFVAHWPEIQKAFTDSTFFFMKLEEQPAAPATN